MQVYVICSHLTKKFAMVACISDEASSRVLFGHIFDIFVVFCKNYVVYGICLCNTIYMTWTEGINAPTKCSKLWCNQTCNWEVYIWHNLARRFPGRILWSSVYLALRINIGIFVFPLLIQIIFRRLYDTFFPLGLFL